MRSRPPIHRYHSFPDERHRVLPPRTAAARLSVRLGAVARGGAAAAVLRRMGRLQAAAQQCAEEAADPAGGAQGRLS
ncbi:hypothetical protein ABTD83_20135, partial [Acinetobacter baumannii]